jgi:hypothetical protein
VYCSAKCRANDPDFKKSITDKYGKHPGHTEEAINKRKQTCTKKYGVEFPLQDKAIHQRTKDTSINRHGGILRGSPEVNKKINDTMVKKYGVQYSSQSVDLLKKQLQTNMDRYGVKYPLQCGFIKEKQEATNFKLSGTKGSSQRHMVNSIPLLENYDWLYNQYITQNKPTTQIAKEVGNVYYGTVINYLRKHKIDIIYNIGFSKISVFWLEQIMKKENIYIQHSKNIGEYKIPGTRFKADGYCIETNTIYEFHGDRFHGNPNVFDLYDQCHPFNDKTASELYQTTIEREHKIKELGYNLVVMWESDFDNR